MKFKNILVFSLGLIGGLFISRFVDKKIKKSSDEFLNTFAFKTVGQDAVDKLAKKNYIKPRIDINELSEKYEWGTDEKNTTNSEINSGTVSDGTGISYDAGQKNVRVSNEVFNSVEEASEQVDGSLQLISDEDPVVTSEETSISISKIPASEFVKAVAAGANTNSFIFNILNKKLYWSLTEKEATPHEVATFVGTSNYADILEEANGSSMGMISPKYYYNDTETCFLKIEPGLAGENN